MTADSAASGVPASLLVRSGRNGVYREDGIRVRNEAGWGSGTRPAAGWAQSQGCVAHAHGSARSDRKSGRVCGAIPQLSPNINIWRWHKNSDYFFLDTL